MGLVQDSRVVITKDTRIQQFTPENIKFILEKDYWWPQPAVDWLYRPVTTASLLVNYSLLGNGENAAGYHVLNFLLHAGNVWLVYLLAWTLFQRAGPAFFAAALWAVHPIGTEAVTNVVGRADLLAAMAVLGGLLLYVRGASSSGSASGACAAATLFVVAAVGVFAKESAAVLIGLMLLWDLSFGIGEWRSGIRRRLPAYAAVGLALVVLAVARHNVFAGLPRPHESAVDNILRTAGFWTARFAAVKVIGLDLWLLLCPIRLSADHGFNDIPLAAWGDLWAWASLAVMGAILSYAIARRRRDPVVFLLAGFFDITLLPTSNLVILISSTMAERFLYLPSVAFAIAVSMLVYRSWSPRLAPALLAALLVFYTGRTMARNLDWKDNLTLAAADVESAPRSFRMHIMLANSLFQQDASRNIDRVIREAETGWAILSALPPAQSMEVPPANLGMYYAWKAKLLGTKLGPRTRPWYDRSLAVLLRAREISEATEKAFDQAQLAAGRPLPARGAYQRLYFSLANDYLQLERFPEAAEALRYARDIDPRVLETYRYLGLVYTAAGQPERAAIAQLQQGLLDGFQPGTLAEVRAAYAGLPDGACATQDRAGVLSLNLDCPRLHTGLCRASADLAQSFIEARLPARAQELRETAVERYGCPAGRTQQ